MNVAEVLNTGISAVAAVATAVAAWQSVKAARESSAAARDSRKSLALHHRPTCSVGIDHGGPDQAGDDLRAIVGFQPAPVRDAEIVWTASDGQERRALLGAGGPVTLTGFQWVDNPGGGYPSNMRYLRLPCRARVTATDVLTNSRWGVDIFWGADGFIDYMQVARGLPMDLLNVQ